MKTSLLTLFIFLSTFSFGQVSHVFSIGPDNYTITFSKTEDNYEFNVSKTGKDKKENFTLPKLDIGTFKNAIYKNLDSLNDTTLAKDTGLSKKIDNIFFTVVANIAIMDDLDRDPEAGTLNINKDIYLYTDRKQTSDKKKKILWLKPRKYCKKNPIYKDRTDTTIYKYKKFTKSVRLYGLKLEVEKVDFVFQNGFIQDLIVDVKIIKDSPCDFSKKDMAFKADTFEIKDFLNAQLKFTNRFGIGFSSKTNYRNLHKINLYPNQTQLLGKEFLYKKRGNTNIDIYNLNEMHVKLGDVIKSYDFKTDLYTTDYSPANQKVPLKGGESITLHKDKTYKILEARVFSDFLGFKSDKPNGLVQTELEKQFPIHTRRVHFLNHRSRVGFGWMEYLKLSGGLTKIEDNNRFLNMSLLDTSKLNTEVKKRYSGKQFTTPINILNYQNSTIGLTTNFLFFDMPTVKSQIHINVGIRFSQTKVQDSIIRTFNSINTKIKDTISKIDTIQTAFNSNVKEYNLSYLQIYPEIIWHILPESRYGFYAAWRPKYFSLLSEDIEFIVLNNKRNEFKRETVSKWINEFELLGYLYINQEKQNGKLFFRWRLNSEMGYSKNNFSQFQVGYSFYILGKGKEKNNSNP